MIHASALRLATSGNHRLRYPVIGRGQCDYNIAFQLSYLLSQISEYYLNRNFGWFSLSYNMYSHTLVMWDKQGWLIQFFCFDGFLVNRRFRRRRRRLRRMLRRMLRLSRNFQIGYFIRLKWEYKFRFYTYRTRNQKMGKYSKIKPKIVDLIFNYKNRIGYHRDFLRYNLVEKIKLPQYFGKFPLVKQKNYLFRQLIEIARTSHLRKLYRVSHQIEKQYSLPFNNPVRFGWRMLRYRRHGSIHLLICYLNYRVNERGSYRMTSFIYPLKNFIKRFQDVYGWSLRCYGRFTRKQRAEHKTYRQGYAVARNNVSYRVEQACITFPLKYGAVGLTLTVNYA